MYVYVYVYVYELQTYFLSFKPLIFFILYIDCDYQCSSSTFFLKMIKAYVMSITLFYIVLSKSFFSEGFSSPL